MSQVEINKQAKLSPHFTLGEMTKTSAKGLDNTPPHGAVMNLKNLCENWLERLREEYNRRYALGRVGTSEGATREGQHARDRHFFALCESTEMPVPVCRPVPLPVCCRKSPLLLIADIGARRSIRLSEG